MPVNKDFYTLAGSSGQSTGYTIDNSLRFIDEGYHVLQDPNSNAGDTRKKNTFSGWIKRGLLSSLMYIYGYRYDATNYQYLSFDSSDRLEFTDVTGGSVQAKLITNRVFRDPHAWYHIVAVWDTADDVAENRIILYVNGIRETSFNTQTLPSENADSGGAGRGSANMRIGTYDYSGNFFDGYMAELHYTDNYAYLPSDFGESDDFGIWIPKEADVSYGASGFYLDFETSGTLGANSKGKGNYLINETGTAGTSAISAADQMLDTPTNNFCVLTPLGSLLDGSLTNGNLTTVLSGNDQFHANFAITEKTYCEVRLDATSNYGGAVGFGTFGGSDDDDNTITFSTAYNNGQINLGNGSVDGNVGGTVSAGDIIMMALDPDTRKWWVGVNGTWRNSGDPGAGSGQVYQYSTTYFTHGTYSDYGGTGALVWGGWKGSANGMTVTWNFGQDSTFNGQESAGSNSDGNGNGSFKYAVPSGFNALCTKSMGS